jgi:hypothetical protein
MLLSLPSALRDRRIHPVVDDERDRMTETVNTIELATEVTAAWLSNPNTRADPEAVPAFLTAIYASITQLVSGEASGTPSKSLRSITLLPSPCANPWPHPIASSR